MITCLINIQYVCAPKAERNSIRLLPFLLMLLFLIINVSNIVPQICEIFTEKKSALKLERMKYLTFIVIIMDIN